MGISANYKIRTLGYRKRKGVSAEIYQRGKFYGGNNGCKVNWAAPKAIISETKDAIQNTPLRAVSKISGCSGDGNWKRHGEFKGNWETLQFGKRP